MKLRRSPPEVQAAVTLPSDLGSLAIHKEYIDHLKKVNDVFYDQIKIADQKAAYIFTFMLAFLITSADGRAVFQFGQYTSARPALALCSLLMAAAATVSIVAAILVVLPRKRSSGTTLFWGGWRNLREKFLAAAAEGDTEYVFREYLANIDNLSLIAMAKYRMVSLAFRALTVMVLAYLLRMLLAS